MFGVVIFDDPEKPGPGWASKGGKSFRVRGTGDLASDHFWWTNLNFMVFQKYGLFKANLKRSDYIRPEMNQLHKELGFANLGNSPANICEVTAEIFKRVMQLAKEQFGFGKPNNDTFGEDIYDIVIGQDKLQDQVINEALNQAHQAWNMCEGVSAQGSRIISFKKPRLMHAMHVLSTPIPSGLWEVMPDAKLPAVNDRLKWAINQQRPILAKASVQQVDPAFASVISFAGGANKERGWLSHPEILFLSQFAKIRIDQVMIAESYAEHPVNKLLQTGSITDHLSISIGILSENYWTSLSVPMILNKKSKTLRQSIYSPRSVWLSASDRFQMVMSAMLMDSAGFTVKAYGKGGLNIAVPKGMISEAIDAANKCGLCSPIGLKEE